jgi:hypothetical protein
MGDAAAGREIKPFRYRLSTAKTDFEPAIVSVSPGDQLGVLIDTEEPLYVYALSVSGQPDPPTWVAPMVLRLYTFVPRSEGQGVPTFHPFLETEHASALLPPGLSQITCAQVTDYDSAIPYEGLWVFTSREPHATLEAWIDSLDAVARSSSNGMVAYADALKLLASGGSVTRGGAPPSQTVQQAREMADSLTAAMLRDGNDWPFDEPRRWSGVWPVQP